jgi:hypothetical protein
MIDRWIKRLLARKEYSVTVTGRLSKIRYSSEGRSLTLDGEMLSGAYVGVVYLRPGCAWDGEGGLRLTSTEWETVRDHLVKHFGSRILIEKG